MEEFGLLLDEGQVALEGIPPAVVLAGEIAAGPARLLLRVVAPDELVAAMAADVLVCAHLVVGRSDDDDRSAGGVELPGEVAANPWDLLEPADVQPGTAEDGVALEFVVLW